MENRNYTLKLYVSEEFLQALKQRQLNRDTPYAEKMMPLLNRLLLNLANAIDRGEAPQPPEAVGFEKGVEIWFRPTSGVVQQLIAGAAKRISRARAVVSLLRWAILVPSAEPEIRSQQELYQVLQEIYGNNGRLHLRDLPSSLEIWQKLDGRLSKEASYAWLKEIKAGNASTGRKVRVFELRNLLHRRQSFLMVDAFQDGIDFPLQFFHHGKLFGLVIPTALAKAVSKKGSKSLTVDIGQDKLSVDWDRRFKALLQALRDHDLDVVHFLLRDEQTEVSLVSSAIVNYDLWDTFDRESWLEKIAADKKIAASSRKISVSNLRVLLYAEQSYLTTDSFLDSLDPATQVFYFKKTQWFLVPTLLAKKITKKGSASLKIDILNLEEDSKTYKDWCRYFANLMQKIKRQDVEVAHFLLRDGTTEVSLVAVSAIDFERWHKFDPRVKAC